MISGLSLKGRKAYSVVLEQSDEATTPVALPIFGAYNRLGSIDMIRESGFTKKLNNFVDRSIKCGSMEVDWEEIGCKYFPNTETLLKAVERSTTLEYDCVTYEGRRWVQALICSDVYDSIQVHSFDKVAKQIGLISNFKASYPEIANRLKVGWWHKKNIAEFVAVSEYIEVVGLKWEPNHDFGQHFQEDIVGFYSEAHKRFSKDEVMLKALDAYRKSNNEFVQ